MKEDQTGRLCRKNCDGRYKEMSLYDDLDGKVTCSKCGDRQPRWKPPETKDD